MQRTTPGTLALLGLLACLLAGPAARASAQRADIPEPMTAWLEGLELLHASRTDAALKWFLARHRKHPDDVCGFYFPTLTYINFSIEGLDRKTRLERGRTLMGDGIELGEDRLRNSRDASTRYCLGALYGLRAEDRLHTSKYVRAAFDAKRARRIMLDLYEDQPDFLDCRFWLGSYDYYADVLPTFVKFFRSLMLIPAGDKASGLEALHIVARHGILDRFNALFVLQDLYERLENDPGKSLEVLRDIRTAYPENLDACLALAWHHVAKTPPDTARTIELHLETLAHVEDQGVHAARGALDRVKLSLAQAYYRDLQPEAAVTLLRPMVSATGGNQARWWGAVDLLAQSLNVAGRYAEVNGVVDLASRRDPASPRMQGLRDVTSTYDEASSKLGAATLPARRLGRRDGFDAARPAFRRLLDEYGELGLIHFMMADTAFETDHADDARVHYEKVVGIGDEFPWYLVPVSYLRLGNLADLEGERTLARTYYRKALSTAGEHEDLREAAQYFIKNPYSRPGGHRR